MSGGKNGAEGPQVDQCGLCTDLLWLPESVKPKGKALDLPVTLTYDHEFRIVTETTKLPVQGAEVSFLCRVARLSFRDRVTRSVIR